MKIYLIHVPSDSLNRKPTQLADEMWIIRGRKIDLCGVSAVKQQFT